MRESAFRIKMVQDIASKLVSFLINLIASRLSFRVWARKEMWIVKIFLLGAFGVTVLAELVFFHNVLVLMC